MEAGQIRQVAPPAEIYESPQSRFVADFVGSVNLFEATVSASDGRTVDLEGAEPMTIRVTDEKQREKGETLWLALRPEKIAVSHERPAETVNSVEGEVWDLAYLGDMTIFHVKLDSGKIVKASMVNAARSSDEIFSYHDRVWLSFRPDAGVLLGA
jgi:putrescine transport system ATP-binding protein